MTFNILYQDEYLVAIHKPPGYFVHTTQLDAKAEEIVLPFLKKQINQWIHTIHRLDRKTQGVLLFALDGEAQRILQGRFATQCMVKEYHAIVRGYAPDQEFIDYDITNDSGKTQSAQTWYTTINRSEIALPHGKFQTSRYSLLKVLPQTGRQHQIRKHLSHVKHPIIGDRPHGCNKQNKLFKDHFHVNDMMLHAQSLTFVHPITHQIIQIESTYDDVFLNVKQLLNL